MNDLSAVTEDSPLQLFLEETHSDYEQTQREVKEIDLLIRQSTAEVERLAQRNAELTNYVRQLNANFETVPRTDLREGYEALQSTLQRLFTMRGQLEKLQADRRNLQRLVDFQERVLTATEGMSALPASAQRDVSDIVRVIQSEETARRSLVRRMHDGPASTVSNFILQAEICQRHFESDREYARVELLALKAAAAATFVTIKDFIFDLRPMMLDDLGVVPTLRRYTEAIQESTKIPVSITITGVERRLESHLEVTIFRAVQELVHNARVHGRAGQIQVFLDIGPDRVLVAVEDNGSGFNPSEFLGPEGGPRREGYGLKTLRDRVEMLGGDFHIESGVSHGTRAEFAIPIHSALDF